MELQIKNIIMPFILNYQIFKHLDMNFEKYTKSKWEKLQNSDKIS